MTLRCKVCCTICEQKYLMRIAVGHNQRQEHIVECENCKSSMALELLIDIDNHSTKINYLENCEETNFKDYIMLDTNGEYKVINLHPELLIPEEFKNDPVYNANIWEASRLVEDRLKKVGNISNDSFKITQEYTINLNQIEENWSILKIAWKMKNHKQKEKLISNQLKKYSSTTESSESNFDDIMFDFNNTILFPDFIDFTPSFAENLKVFFRKNESINEKYLKCIKYYKDNLLNENIKKFYDIYCDFFELYNDFKPLLLYISTSQEVNSNTISSSNNFEKTKMFYGKLFEAYTSNISFITILHNVYKGREFDTLENINLEKYLSTDKAKRTENFKNTEEFKFFDEYVDSKLRNASHHGNIDIKDNMIIYKAGSPLKEYSMTYTKYLEMCTQLFIRFVILHQLQILKYNSYLKYNR